VSPDRGAVVRPAAAPAGPLRAGPMLVGPMFVGPVFVGLGLVGLVLAGCGDGRLALDADPPPGEDRTACRAFLDALPTSLADQPRREVAAAEGGEVWGAAYGDPPITLRCGVARPDAFDETAACTTVNGVDWFIPEEQLDEEQPERYTMTTVYRTPMVEVQLPVAYFPPATAMVDLAGPVTAHLQRTGRCV
jgi:hypothetical protein